ncbi:MAG: hypothetical protein AVDCRST_MAG69-1633 [uncultured Solirubrobacteraceae bacterium]|uniref:EfeO-type cupredoxin-like domain-containing protein n=1 Tax=uncultured Solirubrobacteraceae bacterium TaxID=1162706 RepID=A0A6J4SDD1_9ACTN|nr:MAG: hypothetical protein AVDCRST_MAG69-1633 [uncultured Solirubrobacteraceae bacterium]
MRAILGFGAVLAVILLGLGLWTATPQGGGGLGEDGGAGVDRQGRQEASPGVVAEDREDAEQDGSEGRVEIREGEFSPATVVVPAGSIVTFINRDDVVRRIDFEDERFDDAEIRAGGSHTLEVTGTGRFPFTGSGDGNPSGEIVVE